MHPTWPLSQSWQVALTQYATEPCILVSIIDTRGSTPREIGTRMLISSSHLYGSVGGGHLEAYCVNHARAIISQQNQGYAEITSLTLAASLAQCCGGVLTLLFEYVGPTQRWLHPELAPFYSVYDATAKKIILQQKPSTTEQSPPLYWDRTKNLLIEHALAPKPLIVIAGAGHVGSYLYQYLLPLEVEVRLVDERETINDAYHGWEVLADLPQYLSNLPEHTLVVITTHNHDLDFRCCLSALTRAYPYIGLIGSYSKYTRFCQQLIRRGISLVALERLISPIGIELTTEQTATSAAALSEKHPARIALLTAVELLQAMNGRPLAQTKHDKFHHPFTNQMTSA